jgi:hypothetical protein
MTFVAFVRLVDAVAVATGGKATDGGRPMAAAVTGVFALLVIGLAVGTWRHRTWAAPSALAVFAAATAFSVGVWSPTSFGLNLGTLAVVLWSSLPARATATPADSM